MQYYIKPTSDIFIKYLLGTEQNKDILLSFINAVLEDSGFDKIIDVEIKNPFNLKNFTADKESILDIKATDETGRQYDIEVQSIGNEFYVNRSLYYWAKNYSMQLFESDQYQELLPVICINILDFELMKDVNLIHSCFLLTEKNNRELILTDDLQIHFIELKKFNERVKNLSENLKAWVYYLINEGKTEEDEMKIVLKKNQALNKAHKEYKKFSGSDELREAYEARLKWERDKNTLIYSAKQEGIKEGKIEGIKEGKIEGIKEGKIEGIKEGKIEGIKETIKNMIKEGLTTDQISRITGLTKKEIESVFQDRKN